MAKLMGTLSPSRAAPRTAAGRGPPERKPPGGTCPRCAQAGTSALDSQDALTGGGSAALSHEAPGLACRSLQGLA